MNKIYKKVDVDDLSKESSGSKRPKIMLTAMNCVDIDRPKGVEVFVGPHYGKRVMLTYFVDTLWDNDRMFVIIGREDE